MEERIVKFISALRAMGTRVSLAETADAFRAIEHLGVKDRDSFQLSLQATLIKDSTNIPLFDELFPIFFGGGNLAPMMNITDDLTRREADLLGQAFQRFNANQVKMQNKLIQGELLTQEELDRLAKMVGLNHVDSLRYRNWMIQRMRKALRLDPVRQLILEMADLLIHTDMDKERVDRLIYNLQANRRAIEDQVRLYAGQRIADNISQQPQEEGIEELLNRPIISLTEQEMERLRKEVRRLASILKTRIALRQKRAKAGQMDAKATIRANLKHGSVPIIIKHRNRSKKPRLVILCDVSTSMRFCSELMLSLLYELQDQVRKTYAFAFIDRLEFISPELAGVAVQKAVTNILGRMPASYYNTDLGNSLDDFQTNFLDKIDNRTTLIIVGDGRNNHNSPRLDIFDHLTRRSRRTIWLNPEAPALWDTGDSDMLQYAPLCDIILQASTLTQLTAAIDKMLIG